MNIKSTTILTCFILLSGCQTSQVRVPEQGVNSAKIKDEAKVEFKYLPGDKEQFVFNTKFQKIQKYGYDSFCPSTETFACNNRLNYDKYVGMKGYFVTEEPEHTGFGGYNFYPVILENGESFYFVSNEKFGGKYGSISPIIPLAQHIEIESFKPQPLVEGSDIKITDVEVRGSKKYYTLNNEDKITEEKLSLVREVSSKFGNNSELAELLLSTNIKKDEVDYRFFIQPEGTALRSDIQLYIGFTEENTWLRLKVKYYGDNWLFVNSFTVAADDYRWQSPNYQFKRDHSGGNVWEWIDVAVAEKELEIAKKLASSEKSTIRFRGQKYYSDQQLTQDQKDSIKQMLKIHSLLIDA